MKTNPLIGVLHTLVLFLTMRVRFYKQSIGRKATMKDGESFRVFRHVKIKRGKKKPEPKAVFIIRFRLQNMGIEENKRFSRLPMMVFMGFHGFREKYWMVNETTGEYQGVYKWQTYEDAQNYSKSIAVQFMTTRSKPGSVSYEIVSEKERYMKLL